MVTKLRKIYLSIYQSLGFIFLISIISTIVIFFGLMIFFLINSNWIAPTILSLTSDKMLHFQASLLSQTQSINTIEIQGLTAKRQLNTFIRQRDDMLRYEKQLTQAINHEIGIDQHFATAKQLNVNQNKELALNLERIAADVLKSKSVGLLTTAEATQTLVSIQQFKSQNVDLEFMANKFRRQKATLIGSPKSIDSLSAIRQQIDLKTLINTLDDNIVIQKETLKKTKIALKQANEVMKTLSNTAYMQAFHHKGSNLAFLPYENDKHIKLKDPVFNCYLFAIFCYKVGTISKIYNDEQLIDFPIFNIRFTKVVRGTLIDMDIYDQSAMYSKVLFFGKKPLLF